LNFRASVSKGHPKSGHSAFAVFAPWHKNRPPVASWSSLLPLQTIILRPPSPEDQERVSVKSRLLLLFLLHTVRSFHYCPHQRYACYPSPSSPPYHRPRRFVFFHQHTRFPDTRPFCAVSIHRAHRPHIDRNALTLLSVPLLPTHPLMSSATLSSLDPFTVLNTQQLT
jgi:hypothetical protein